MPGLAWLRHGRPTRPVLSGWVVRAWQGLGLRVARRLWLLQGLHSLERWRRSVRAVLRLKLLSGFQVWQVVQ